MPTYGERNYIIYQEFRNNSTDPAGTGITIKINTMQTLQNLKDRVANFNLLIKTAQQKGKAM